MGDVVKFPGHEPEEDDGEDEAVDMLARAIVAARRMEEEVPGPYIPTRAERIGEGLGRLLGTIVGETFALIRTVVYVILAILTLGMI